MQGVKWEYKTQDTRGPEALVPLLSALGDDKWELIAVVPKQNGVGCIAFFKRPQVGKLKATAS